MDLTIIGHVMNETIKFPHDSLGPVLGGPAAYSSVIAACLGARVGLVTRTGPDLPQELLLPLFQAGIDTRGMRRVRESRHSLLIYDNQGNKTLQFPKTGEVITLRDVPAEYFESGIFYLATLEGEVSLDLLETLTKNTAVLAIDLGGYGGAHCSEHTEEGLDATIKAFFPKINIAKASLEDCDYLFPYNNYSINDLAQILVDLGAAVGIITCGEKGVTVATIDGDRFSIPPLTREVKDCTGAGDAFSAGFLVHYRRERNVREAALFASATASLLIEKSGGITPERIPSLASVQERVSKFVRY